MRGFSPQEIKGVINGLIAGLRSGDVDEEQIRAEVIAEYRRIVNLGWASREMVEEVAAKIEAESGVAPPEWLLCEKSKPEVKQVRF